MLPRLHFDSLRFMRLIYPESHAGSRALVVSTSAGEKWCTAFRATAPAFVSTAPARSVLRRRERRWVPGERLPALAKQVIYLSYVVSLHPIAVAQRGLRCPGFPGRAATGLSLPHYHGVHQAPLEFAPIL